MYVPYMWLPCFIRTKEYDRFLLKIKIEDPMGFVNQQQTLIHTIKQDIFMIEMSDTF